jgi:hypothetical protein
MLRRLKKVKKMKSYKWTLRIFIAVLERFAEKGAGAMKSKESKKNEVRLDSITGRNYA